MAINDNANVNANARLQDLANATAFDSNGDKLGSVNDVYINDATGQPDFVDINHGLFNMSNSIVPLRGHTLRNGELHLAFEKDRIKDAPNLTDNDGHMTNEEQDAFYRHYAVGSAQDSVHYEDDYNTDGRTDRNRADLNHEVAGDAHDRERRDFADHDEATMVRSEEHLNVDKQRQEAGKVRLRKYVVHDTETIEVPVEREEVRIEREPVSDAEAQTLRGNQKLGDEEATVTLHEERVNVTKDSVPVEKVSLGKETVRDTETVTEDVAKERIETDGVEGDLRDKDLRDNR